MLKASIPEAHGGQKVIVFKICTTVKGTTVVKTTGKKPESSTQNIWFERVLYKGKKNRFKWVYVNRVTCDLIGSDPIQTLSNMSV